MTKKHWIKGSWSVSRSQTYLLMYVHAIAFIHGIGFLSQGWVVQEGLIKYALTDHHAWHGGMPALSLFPVSAIAGLVTVLLTILSMILILKPIKSSWYRLLPVMIFMTGGGFVFIYITSIVTVSLLLAPTHKKTHSVVGRWLMMMLIGWFFLSWILGWTMPSLMRDMSVMTFVCFDLVLPLAIVLTHCLPYWVSNQKR